MSINQPFDDSINKSVKFYNDHAEQFFERTARLDMSELYAPFLERLPAGAHILDAGCGSGRDSLAFLQKGYRVTAFDASEEMVKRASQHIGQPVLHLSFVDLDFHHAFDGIWACASLLHVSKDDMDKVINRLSQSLKPKGVMYMSFKYGNGMVWRDGRMFNNYDEKSIQALVTHHPELEVGEIWVTTDIRPDREDEKWLNVILIKG